MTGALLVMIVCVALCSAVGASVALVKSSTCRAETDAEAHLRIATAMLVDLYEIDLLAAETEVEIEVIRRRTAARRAWEQSS